ncbi:MAG: hypothetical protein WKF31_11605 [Thermoleophilaceae bacterium]
MPTSRQLAPARHHHHHDDPDEGRHEEEHIDHEEGELSADTAHAVPDRV